MPTHRSPVKEIDVINLFEGRLLPYATVFFSPCDMTALPYNLVLFPWSQSVHNSVLSELRKHFL